MPDVGTSPLTVGDSLLLFWLIIFSKQCLIASNHLHQLCTSMWYSVMLMLGVAHGKEWGQAWNGMVDILSSSSVEAQEALLERVLLSYLLLWSPLQALLATVVSGSSSACCCYSWDSHPVSVVQNLQVDLCLYSLEALLQLSIRKKSAQTHKK